jgi:hypothetical protein
MALGLAQTRAKLRDINMYLHAPLSWRAFEIWGSRGVNADLRVLQEVIEQQHQ